MKNKFEVNQKVKVYVPPFGTLEGIVKWKRLIKTKDVFMPGPAGNRLNGGKFKTEIIKPHWEYGVEFGVLYKDTYQEKDLRR